MTNQIRNFDSGQIHSPLFYITPVAHELAAQPLTECSYTNCIMELTEEIIILATKFRPRIYASHRSRQLIRTCRRILRKWADKQRQLLLDQVEITICDYLRTLKSLERITSSLERRLPFNALSADINALLEPRVNHLLQNDAIRQAETAFYGTLRNPIKIPLVNKIKLLLLQHAQQNV
ncbi:MAG: hypothetical protein GKR77_08005 [Legionellales bacterium]|nr:hypothetical protein [Legionellales bacterium]